MSKQDNKSYKVTDNSQPIEKKSLVSKKRRSASDSSDNDSISSNEKKNGEAIGKRTIMTKNKDNSNVNNYSLYSDEQYDALNKNITTFEDSNNDTNETSKVESIIKQKQAIEDQNDNVSKIISKYKKSKDEFSQEQKEIFDKIDFD